MFAESIETYALPVPGHITISAGYWTPRPRGLWIPSLKQFVHASLDIVADRFSPVHAAMGGEVVECYYKKTWSDSDRIKHPLGNYVVIELPNKHTQLYAHLQAFYVRGGTMLEKGMFFAQVGDTGAARGCHLHFAEFDENGIPVKTTYKFGITWQTIGNIYAYQSAQ